MKVMERNIQEKLTKEISIDLSSLDIPSESGELKVSLVYEDEEILSVSTNLEIEGEFEEKFQMKLNYL